MKIVGANLQLASSHASTQHHEVSESLKVWTGPRRPRFAGEAPMVGQPPADNVTLSDAGKAANAHNATDQPSDSAVDHDPRLRLIRSLMALLTGTEIKVFDASDLQTPSEVPAVAAPATPTNTPPPAAGFGIEYDFHESYSESEKTDFSASGTVTTADGKTISFDLQLSMARSYHEETNVSLRLGDAARKVDPLVLNFSGKAAELTDQRFSFDLNGDGNNEQISFVEPGSGFLVFDRNHDGKINNGKELFGPATGDGFAELAELDGDHNGWIDENDPAYRQLEIWTRNNAGQDQRQSLAEAGLGAISLSRISTPFAIKSDANQVRGQICTSGIFLQESGTTGTIQQIDLTA